MPYYERQYFRGGSDGGGCEGGRCGVPMPPGIKWLLIANGVVFFIQMLLQGRYGTGAETFYKLFTLNRDAITHLWLWQFVTYSFLHSGILHIGFNMLMLWMFGIEVEWTLGTRRFLWLYFGAVMAGGICMIPLALFWGIPTLGASAGVFGVMAMFARLFPDRIVLAFMVIPMRARTLILTLVGIEVLLQVAGGGNVAHMAHLGGFVVGWFFPSMAHWRESARWWWQRRQGESQERQAREVRERVDKLLEKVGREGIGSLTKGERRFLEAVRDKFRR